jgi:hypothetical protein
MLEQRRRAASGITAARFQNVPLTLVSHYGEKPPAFVELIAGLQHAVARELGAAFVPCDLRQVHATIVGLEGTRIGTSIRNDNYLRWRHEERTMDLAGMLAWLRSSTFPRFDVQVGGFQSALDYPFTSQGRHPSLRSFSIQGNRAVAMGWPRMDRAFPPLLAELRAGFERFGVLHKWHPHPGVLDNDLFFVVGHCATADPAAHRRTEEIVREQMAARSSFVPVNSDRLSFVAYSDPTLPLASSRAFQVNDEPVTGNFLEQLYG